jgi:hypothetical protein
MSSTPYGQAIAGLVVDGREIRAGVFNEREVRTAAGLTLVVGAFAFVEAWLGKEYAPIKLVTILFAIEFGIRVAVGIRYSPFGWLARLITSGQEPEWVSAKPKRFAWIMGLVLSSAMVIITQANIHGMLPLTVCVFCMTLMWMEAVLGLCLGCQIYAFSVRRGWFARDEAYEICAGGACTIEERGLRA